MTEFKIYDLPVGAGRIGISQMPGRTGDLPADLQVIQNWPAELVVSMTTLQELRDHGATDLADDLLEAGIKWLSVPVSDFGAPNIAVQTVWTAMSPFFHQVLAQGGRILFHCYGGCGRSGMAAMRVMVESGIRPDDALAALRDVRPCAVETPNQKAWASKIS